MSDSTEMIARSARRQVHYPIRPSFVARFGEADAVAIEAAAEKHKNGVHDNPGSDPFRWAIVICIGYDCMSRFREDHGIHAPWDQIQAWIKGEADLASHDGDVDYMSLLAGTYNEYVAAAGGERGAP